MQQTKVCTKCGKELPATPEYWHKQKCGKYGLKSKCKDCINEYVREYMHERRCNDPEYREQERERQREYRNDPEYRKRDREQARERYQNDPEYRKRQREYKRERYQNDPEYRKRMRKRRNNPEYREQERERRNNPEYRKRQREQVRKRRARKHDLPFSFTADDEQFALDYFNGCCAYCGNPVQDLFDTTLHFDHYIPLSYDGDDNPGTVPENMLPTCSNCNLSKNATMPDEWIYRTFGKRKGKKIIERIMEYFSIFTDS